MSQRIQKIYWDLDNELLQDVSGASSTNKYPYIYYKEKPQIQLFFRSEDSGDSSGNNFAYLNLSNNTWFSICVDDDFNHGDSSASGPLCKVTDFNIIQTDLATLGKLTFTLDANTLALRNAITNSQELTGVWLEVLGYNSQMDLEFVTRIPFDCRNIMDPSGGTGVPAAVVDNTNFSWYVNSSGQQCLRILNDDGLVLADLTP